MYRTDSADPSEGGQRLVSNTFMINVPENLPEISLSKTTGYRAANNLKVMKVDNNLLDKVSYNR